MLLPTDKIRTEVGCQRGNVTQFINWVQSKGAVGPFREWVTRVNELADIARFDRVFVWFHAAYETDCFTNEKWLRGDTGGFSSPWGVLDDDPLDLRDRENKGHEAADVHIAALLAVSGQNLRWKPLQPAKHIYAPQFLTRLVEKMQSAQKYPRPMYLQDFMHPYTTESGARGNLLHREADYMTKLCVFALTAPVNIPDKQFYYEHYPFPELFKAQVVREVFLLEGPYKAKNRYIQLVTPGTVLYLEGKTQGHGQGGDTRWYYTPETPNRGYIHEKDVVPFGGDYVRAAADPANRMPLGWGPRRTSGICKHGVNDFHVCKACQAELEGA